jgi:hypothetical protein
MRNAATAFAAIYGREEAIKHGFNMDIHRLQQSEQSELEAFALAGGYNISNFNKGLMSQMMADPSDTTNDCYSTTEDCNAEIMVLADFAEYTLGGFDVATFTEMFKIMNIKLM